MSDCTKKILKNLGMVVTFPMKSESWTIQKLLTKPHALKLHFLAFSRVAISFYLIDKWSFYIGLGKTGNIPEHYVHKSLPGLP